MAMIPPKKALQGNTSHLMPSELMDKCVGQRMWVSTLSHFTTCWCDFLLFYFLPSHNKVGRRTSHLSPEISLGRLLLMQILMKGEREYVGMLVGFDTYVNMVLQVEYAFAVHNLTTHGLDSGKFQCVRQ